jgi:hypothetical protein
MAAVLGAGASLAGGLLQSRSAKKAAKNAAAGAEFNPFNVRTGFGSTNFNGNTAFGQLSDPMQQIQNMLTGQAAQGMGGPFGNVAAFQNLAQGGAFPMLGQGANQLMQAPDFASGGFNNLQQGMGQLGGLFGGLGMQGMNAAFGAPSTAGLNNMLMGQGQQLLGVQGPGSFQDVAADQLNLMRQQAQPHEQRLFNQLNQHQFNTGQAGTTGGSLQTEAFARGMGEADISRVLQSQQFAQGLQNQQFGQSFAQNQLGAGLLGQAMQGIGQDQLQARALGGLGQGFLGQLPGMQQGVFGSGLQAQQAIGQQGLNRMQAAQGMFGFGQDIGLQQFQQGLQALQASQGIEGMLQNQIALGANMGSAQAHAGAQAGNLRMQGAGSPFGGFLTGLGGSITDLFGS